MGRKKRERIAAELDAIASAFEARIDACIARAITAHPVLCSCPHCTSHRISGHRTL